MTGWIIGTCSVIIASFAQILLKKSAEEKAESHGRPAPGEIQMVMIMVGVIVAQF